MKLFGSARIVRKEGMHRIFNRLIKCVYVSVSPVLPRPIL